MVDVLLEGDVAQFHLDEQSGPETWDLAGLDDLRTTKKKRSEKRKKKKEKTNRRDGLFGGLRDGLGHGVGRKVLAITLIRVSGIIV